MSDGPIKNAVIIILLIGALVLGSYSYLLQLKVEELQAGKESLEARNKELMENYSKLLEAHGSLLQELTSLNQSYVALLQNYESLSNDYATLLQNNTVLMEQYQKVLVEYVKLTVDYAYLNQSYNELLQNYTDLMQLSQEALELKRKYDELLNAYQSLLVNYTAIKNEYEKLYFAVYEPLNEIITPSEDELKNWLATDKTNEMNYTYPDFVCGDFAVMLSLHAKLNHWDMGIMAVLGKTSNGEDIAHAFNAIRCKDKGEGPAYIVYIEPQNDAVFYGPIVEGSWYNHPGFGEIYVEKLIIVVLYQPPFE